MYGGKKSGVRVAKRYKKYTKILINYTSMVSSEVVERSDTVKVKKQNDTFIRGSNLGAKDKRWYLVTTSYLPVPYRTYWSMAPRTPHFTRLLLIM